MLDWLIDINSPDTLLRSELMSFRAQWLFFSQFSKATCDVMDSPIAMKLCEFLRLYTKKESVLKLKAGRKTKNQTYLEYRRGIDGIYNTYYNRLYKGKFGNGFSDYIKTPSDYLATKHLRQLDGQQIVNFKLIHAFLNDAIIWYSTLSEDSIKLRCMRYKLKPVSLSTLNEMCVSDAWVYLQKVKGLYKK